MCFWGVRLWGWKRKILEIKLYLASHFPSFFSYEYAINTSIHGKAWYECMNVLYCTLGMKKKWTFIVNKFIMPFSSYTYIFYSLFCFAIFFWFWKDALENKKDFVLKNKEKKYYHIACFSSPSLIALYMWSSRKES